MLLTGGHHAERHSQDWSSDDGVLRAMCRLHQSCKLRVTNLYMQINNTQYHRTQRLAMRIVSICSSIGPGRVQLCSTADLKASREHSAQHCGSKEQQQPLQPRIAAGEGLRSWALAAPVCALLSTEGAAGQPPPQIASLLPPAGVRGKEAAPGDRALVQLHDLELNQGWEIYCSGL